MQLAYTSLPQTNPTAFKSAQHRWRGPEASNVSTTWFCNEAANWGSHCDGRADSETDSSLSPAKEHWMVDVLVIMEAWNSGIHNWSRLSEKYNQLTLPTKRQLTLWSFIISQAFRQNAWNPRFLLLAALDLLDPKKQQWPVTELYPPVCCPK